MEYGYIVAQSSTAYPLFFWMEDSASAHNGKTGLAATLVVKLRKSGGAAAAPGGGISEVDATNLPGWYAVGGNSTDTNTKGPLILRATATGAWSAEVCFLVAGADLQNGTNLGLSALPAAAAGNTGGLLTWGTGAGQLSPDGSGNVPISMGQLPPASPSSGTVGEHFKFGGNLVTWGTAQAGAAGSITLAGATGASNDYLVGNRVRLNTGTGAGQGRTITAFAGATKVATVDRPWVVNPDASTQYAIYGDDGPALTATLAVTAGAADKTGYSLTAAEHTAIAADVLDATTAAHAAAGTIGAKIGATSTYAGGDTPGTSTLLARLTDPRAANLDKLDVATSTLSTYAGGPVASVTAPVTAGNLPTDYQQRGVAVTLPDPAPAGYGGASAGQLAAAVLATPANLLATDATGRVTVGSVADKAGYALAPDGVDLVVVETGVNLRQASSLILAGQTGVLSGAGTTTITIQGGNVTETRIAATVDTAGNRSSVALTPPL